MRTLRALLLLGLLAQTDVCTVQILFLGGRSVTCLVCPTITTCS